MKYTPEGSLNQRRAAGGAGIRAFPAGFEAEVWWVSHVGHETSVTPCSGAAVFPRWNASR